MKAIRLHWLVEIPASEVGLARRAVTAWSQPQCDALASELAPALRGRVMFDPISRALYATDASIYQIRPALVVLPESEQDVSAAVLFAQRHGLSVSPRGAGTGLAGECLGNGIVLDFSAGMNRIVRTDGGRALATVEPGCVLEVLNDQVAPLALAFGPDPASGTRATLGGILANNSTGAHSLTHGHAGAHVRQLRAVLADGSMAVFHDDGRMEGDSPLARGIAREIPALLEDWGPRIETHWPAVRRNRAGYSVRAAWRDGRVNWPRLLCGSEGSLAIFTQAELRLSPLPRCRVLVQATYASLAALAAVLVDVVAAGATMAELLDGQLAALARRAYPDAAGLLPDAAAQLVVEVAGNDAPEVERALLAVEQALAGKAKPASITVLRDPGEQARLLAVRHAAAPLLYRDRQWAKPISAIEDVAVPVARLPEYLDRVGRIAAEEGVGLAYYAHAGDGELHVSPRLDLYQPGDRQRLARLAERVYRVCWELGGSISGEHGCGLLRSGWLEEQYGPLYQLFRRIKSIFDPEGLLNPDRVVTNQTGPGLMLGRLRHDWPLEARGPLASPGRAEKDVMEELKEIAACNGCGTCRSAQVGARMCPVFRATGLEAAAPRAKANLLRHLAGGFLDESALGEPGLRQAVELCIGCRMCAQECPSGVNVAALMQRMKAVLARRDGLSIAQTLLARGGEIGFLGDALAPLANPMLRLRPVRWMMERLAGLDARRPFPPFAAGAGLLELRRRASARRPERPVERVIYFVDLFARFHDRALGRAVVDVLSRLGVEVLVPPQQPAGLPAVACGDWPPAGAAVRGNVQSLLPLVRQGARIVCSEPSAALCIRDDWPIMMPGAETAELAAATVELTDYLLGLHARGLMNDPDRAADAVATEPPLHLAYHTPCHLRSLHGRRGAELARLTGAVVEDVGLSCCGIAGTFGFRREGYDLSMRMGRPMLDALRASAAPLGLTECSTCAMQMTLAAGKPVLHPAMVVARALGLGYHSGR